MGNGLTNGLAQQHESENLKRTTEQTTAPEELKRTTEQMTAAEELEQMTAAEELKQTITAAEELKRTSGQTTADDEEIPDDPGSEPNTEKALVAWAKTTKSVTFKTEENKRDQKGGHKRREHKRREHKHRHKRKRKSQEQEQEEQEEEEELPESPIKKVATTPSVSLASMRNMCRRSGVTHMERKVLTYSIDNPIDEFVDQLSEKALFHMKCNSQSKERKTISKDDVIHALDVMKMKYYG